MPHGRDHEVPPTTLATLAGGSQIGATPPVADIVSSSSTDRIQQNLDNSAVLGVEQLRMGDQPTTTTVVVQPTTRDAQQGNHNIAEGDDAPLVWSSPPHIDVNKRKRSAGGAAHDNPLFYSVTAHGMDDDNGVPANDDHGGLHPTRGTAKHHNASQEMHLKSSVMSVVSPCSSRSGAASVDDPPLEFSPQWYTDDDDSMGGSPFPSRFPSRSTSAAGGARASHHRVQPSLRFPSPCPSHTAMPHWPDSCSRSADGMMALEADGGGRNAASWGSRDYTDHIPHAASLFPSDSNAATTTPVSPVPSGSSA